MMELADMQDLGSCASALGFKSPYPHQMKRGRFSNFFIEKRLCFMLYPLQ